MEEDQKKRDEEEARKLEDLDAFLGDGTPLPDKLEDDKNSVSSASTKKYRTLDQKTARERVP